MANKVPINDQNGQQVFPITHVTAVIDNYGNSVEQILGAQTDLINQKQLEIGAVPGDLKPTPGSSHWVTSGGISDAVNSWLQINLPAAKTYGISNNGSWNMDNSRSHYQMPVTAGETYKLTANASSFTRIWWCTAAATPTSGGTVPFCSGQTSCIVIGANTSEYLTAPSDAAYMYIDASSTNGPQAVYALKSVKEAVDELQDEVDELNENTSYCKTINLPQPIAGCPSNNGLWNINTNLSHYQLPVTAGREYIILSNASDYTRIWWCTAASTPTSGQYIPFCQGQSSCIVIGANTEETFTAPSDAAYMYIDGTSGHNPQKVSDILNLQEFAEDFSETIAENIVALSDAVSIPYNNSQAVIASTGKLETATSLGHSNYIETRGASKIYINTPLVGSSKYGISFYFRESDSTYISGQVFSQSGTSEWMMYDVPKGANFFRMTLRENTSSSYRLAVTTESMMQTFMESVSDIVATHIVRNAVPISDKGYIYAFGNPQQLIIGSKAYVLYAANANVVDGDSVGFPNVPCCAVVDLFDLSHTIINPTQNSTKYSDNTPASPTAVGYVTNCPTPDGKIARFALMRFGNKNPYYCYAKSDPAVQSFDYVTCRLQYSVGGTNYNVDFTVNNYRQMIVDMGYADSYVASTADYVNNINIHYDTTENIYYAVMCNAQSAINFPMVLMQSTDMATWSPKAYLGKNIDAGEIAAIYKGGVAYVCYRTFNHGMKYLIRDVSNSQTLSDGTFPVSTNLLSKPDAFTFDNEVYLAVNIDPSVYGELLFADDYKLDARQQIAIYKVVDGVPKYFRRINNPTGLQYFSFMETPPMYATTQSSNPMYAQGAIYLSFSEDRRHIYRRQIAQMSYADVTALFAGNLSTI